MLAIAIWVKEERRWLRWFAAIAVGGVVVQAILGGQVVIQLLHYWLPVIHACFAQIVFAAVLSIAVFTSKWWVSERPQARRCRLAIDACRGDRECGSDLFAGDFLERASGIRICRSGRTWRARCWCWAW